MAAESTQVKVLGTRESPFVLRARIALHLKSAESEFLEEHFPGKSELLLKTNPVMKKVPVFIHGDVPIPESLVLLHYIDETWSQGYPILPSHPHDRAVARFWASYIDEKRHHADGRKNVEGATEGVALLENAFVGISKGKKFFGGETIGYLDIAVGCFLKWLDVMDVLFGQKFIDEIKTPNLFRWAQYFTYDPAVKDLLPQTEELVEFAKFLINMLKAPAKN